MQRKQHNLPPLVIGALLLLFASTGCTSTRIAGEPIDFDTINRHAETRVAHLTLKSGRVIQARDFRIRGDSISWTNRQSGAIWTESMAGVAEVRFISRGQGAAQGPGIGFAVGALSFGLAMAGSAPCGDPCMFGASRGEAFKTGAIMGGIAALPLSTLIGASAGSRVRFVLLPQDVDETPVVAADDGGW